MRRTAALIVGGGPAGAAAAIRLALGGARPLLIERTTEPHDVVCGGFLSGDTLARLARLGIDVAALGARPIARLRLVWGERSFETALPFAAAGLSRRTLDAALLARAAEAGAEIERGVSARHGGGLAVQTDGGEISGDALLLASGKHELRGLARAKPGGGAVGFRRALPPSPALAGLAGSIELHLFDGGYAGLLVQEDGSANLCLSVERARFAENASPDALLASLERAAPRLIARAGAGGGAWQAIAGVPYGWRTSATEPGLFRIGDQAAVIASLAGDGIAIALASGAAAAEALLREGPAGAVRFQRDFARAAARPLDVAGAAKWVAESGAWRPLMWPFLRVPGLAQLIGRATRIG